MKKKIFFALLIILFVSVLPFFRVLSDDTTSTVSGANGNNLEVTYPTIGGQTITTTNTSIPIYIKYIYYFVIAISGLVAFGVLVYAGFIYITSTGRPERMKEGIDQAKAAFIGLVIIFCSWIILNMINPVFTTPYIMDAAAVFPTFPIGVSVCSTDEGADFSTIYNDYWSQYQPAFQQLQSATTTQAEETATTTLTNVAKDATNVMANINKNCTFIKGDTTITKDNPYFCYMPADQNETAGQHGAVFVYQLYHPTLDVMEDYSYAVFDKGAGCSQVDHKLVTEIKPFAPISDCSDCTVMVYDHTDLNQGFASTGCNQGGGKHW